MWQVLVAAAVAGSTGLVAKRVLSSASDQTPDQEAAEPSTPRATISAPNAFECESSYGRSEDIFRFSSSKSSNARSKGSRKKLETPSSRKSAVKGAEVEGSRGNHQTAHCKSGRKFHICLKRRKTGKNVAPKCGSCSSKG